MSGLAPRWRMPACRFDSGGNGRRIAPTGGVNGAMQLSNELNTKPTAGTAERNDDGVVD
jgi:hypothetical protein